MLRAHFPIWTFVLTSLCLVTALAAQAQREQRLRHVYTLHGDRAGARLGSSLAGGHDLDKGGVADILVGAPLDAAFVNASNGLVRAYRGEDGQALWALRGETGDRFGHAVVMVDDIDGDGVTDFAVGAWGGEDRRAAVPLDQEGYVEFFSSAGGINGYPLSLGRVYGGVAKAHLGEALCRVPDLDADGVDEVMAGANQNGTGSGFALVISSKTRKVLYTLKNPLAQSNTDLFGTNLAAGDLDGDGSADLVVGAPGETHNTQLRAGRIHVFSGKNGRYLRQLGGTPGSSLGDGALHVVSLYLATGRPAILAGRPKLANDSGGLEYYDLTSAGVVASLVGMRPGDRWGHSIAVVGDQDGDGYDDYLVGSAALGATLFGSAAIVSGKTLVFEVTQPTFVGDGNYDAFGYAVASAGDLDGDKREDFIITAPLDDDGALDAGSLRILTAKEYWFSSDTHVVDVASGGQQVLTVDRGASGNGLLYLVLGSMTGTGPTLVAGLSIPLTFDGYTDLMFQLPNLGLLFDSRRVLPPSGERSAVWTAIPPAIALRGQKLFHAAVLFDPKGWVASRALPLYLR